MPLIRLRQPWTRQPQGAVRVNASSPIARGLQFLFLPGVGNLMIPGQVTILGSGGFEPGPAGIMARSVYTATGANEIEFPVLTNAAGDRTLIAYTSNVGSGVFNGVQTHRTSDADSNDGLYVGNTQFRAYIDNNWSPIITIAQSEQPRIAASRRRSNQVSGWFDGTASAESVTGTRAMTSTVARIGRDGASNSIDNQTYWMGYWGRYLTDAELTSLQLYPWQLFAPIERRIWVPAAGGGTTVAPSKGAAVFTGTAPTITQPRTITPAAGAALYTGYAPTVSQGASVAPSVGHIAATGYAPSISQPKTLAPAAGHAAVTGYAPTVEQPTGITPSKGAIIVSGYAPTISQPRTIAPAKGAATFGGYTPVVSQIAAIAPSKGAIVVSGYTPTIVQPRTVAPTKGAAVFRGYTPTIGLVDDLREVLRFDSPICMAVTADSYITRAVTMQSTIDIESTT